MAAPAKLTTHAKEESAYLIEVTFADFGGTSVVPTSFIYSVTDQSGTAINALSAIALTSGVIGTTTSILIYGTSLSITNSEDTIRIFTCNGLWDSTYGTSSTYTGEAQFIIRVLKPFLRQLILWRRYGIEGMLPGQPAQLVQELVPLQ